MTQPNIDCQEVNKFETIAHDWWDPQGNSKMLHTINPVRLQFILQKIEGYNASHSTAFREKHQVRVEPTSSQTTWCDVGCGGGILTEALAKESKGAVTGLEVSAKLIQIAKTHAEAQRLSIHYVESTVESFAQTRPEYFSVVTCMELLEHVPNPESVIQACSQLAAPGGHLFFSTLNRTPKAWVLAILGAEYCLGWLPRGTHQYERFIRPSELAAVARKAGLWVMQCQGITYAPFSGMWKVSDEVSTNYIMHCIKA